MNTNLKLFSLNLSWRGGLVAVAETKEEALKIWQDNTIHGESPRLKNMSQEDFDDIKEQPLVAGAYECFLGDS